MSQIITASIDVMKIYKTRLISGKKGTYLNVTIWVNDQPDQFGNNVSIEQKTDKGQNKIYLGNGKTFHKKTEEKPQTDGKITTGSMSDINDLPGANNPDNLPF